MSRPALIIGVGGTGQKIVSFIKKDLLEIYHGKLPQEVKLLSFDTAPQDEHIENGQNSTQKKPIKAGAVQLEKDIEYFSIGYNTYPIATEISNGKYPHLDWFPATEFIRKFPAAAFQLQAGAAQIRHFGRMALFLDVATPASSKFIGNINKALTKLYDLTSNETKLEIIIVGSLAGGTGAGMLIDTGILVKNEAQKVFHQNENFLVRGFFVTPSAFTRGGAGTDHKMFARSFAAWRELDRFLLGSAVFGQQSINYTQNGSGYKVASRIFDVSYIIDANREHNSLSGKDPENGLYPEIAQVISSLIDEAVGKYYTEYITTNLNGQLQTMPIKPYHSSFGAYTLKVPYYFAEQQFNHMLALNVLNTLAQPKHNSNGNIVDVSENSNGEIAKVITPQHSARDFHRLSEVEGVSATLFTSHIANTLDQKGNVESQYQAKYIHGGDLLSNYSNVGQDADGKKLMDSLRTELDLKIWTLVHPSSEASETPESAYTRITTNVEKQTNEHYGMQTQDGRNLTGKYGETLKQIHNVQTSRYRALHREYAYAVLNGKNANPSIAKGGKIGYLRAFYNGIIIELTEYKKFVEAIRDKRGQQNFVANSVRAKIASEEQFNYLKSKKCWITFWDGNTHPDARQAERDFFAVNQKYIDQRKIEILISQVEDSVADMINFIQTSKEDLEKWIEQLAIGNNSLLNTIDSSWKDEQTNHEVDQHASLVLKHFPAPKYEVDESYVSDILNKFHWNVEADQENNLKFGLTLNIPRPETESVENIKLQRSGEKAAASNFARILELTQEKFKKFELPPSIAEELTGSDSPFPEPKDLAENLRDLADPHYTKVVTGDGPAVTSIFTRVEHKKDPIATNYFQKFESEFGSRFGHLTKLHNSVVDSQDDYKLTILRSDDLMLSNDFSIWEICKESYINMLTKADGKNSITPTETHIFRAEQNACEYELKMHPVLNIKYRILSPHVVSLLNDREKFELFFYALAFGMVKESSDARGMKYWSYTFPEIAEVHLTTPQGFGGQQQTTNSYHWTFDLIHNFLQGKDVRPNAASSSIINWEKLKDHILTKRFELKEAKTVKLLEAQITKGFVSDLDKFIQEKRENIPSNRHEFIERETEDLKDLAHYVYKNAIAETINFFKG